MRWPKPLLRNNPNANKYDFGHVLVIAGSASMLGAAALVAQAAKRSGAGLVTSAVPNILNSSLQAKISSDIMTMRLGKNQGYFTSLPKSIQKDIYNKYNALAIGPGIGRELKTQVLARKLFQTYPHPMVVDADALYAISKIPLHANSMMYPRVLTPHIKEMSYLLNCEVKTIELNRMKAARLCSKNYNAVVLLKGPQTIVVNQKGSCYLNKSGCVALATAGSGDVLTGMIGGILAQRVDPYEAACFAAWMHGKIAQVLAKERKSFSIMATDLIGKMNFNQN